MNTYLISFLGKFLLFIMFIAYMAFEPLLIIIDLFASFVMAFEGVLFSFFFKLFHSLLSLLFKIKSTSMFLVLT